MMRGQGVRKGKQMLGAVRGAGREEQGSGVTRTRASKQHFEKGQAPAGARAAAHRPPTDMGCAEPGRRCSDEGPYILAQRPSNAPIIR